jgi:putative spermidine/putrescine transport system ATP-binding protein
MVVAGFIRPDGGSLCFDDTEIIRLPPHRRDIGVVFQNYALFPHMNVSENVAFPLRLRSVPRAEREQRVSQALELVRLSGLAARRVNELSGGQKQRVALARAVVFAPKVLLMDEPLSALDKNLREQMQIELKRLHSALGMTTIYVTHDQGEAMTMSDRVAVMNNGRIVQIDTPRNLYERPPSKFVATFLGESNLIPVTLKEGAVRFGEIKLQTADYSRAEGNHRGLLVVRPEQLRIVPAGQRAGPNRLKATVRETIFRGNALVIYGDLEDGTEITTRVSANRQAWERMPNRGEIIALEFHPEDSVIVGEE